MRFAVRRAGSISQRRRLPGSGLLGSRAQQCIFQFQLQVFALSDFPLSCPRERLLGVLHELDRLHAKLITFQPQLLDGEFQGAHLFLKSPDV